MRWCVKAIRVRFSLSVRLGLSGIEHSGRKSDLQGEFDPGASGPSLLMSS